jgi:hypothetical protein
MALSGFISCGTNSDPDPVDPAPRIPAGQYTPSPPRWNAPANLTAKPVGDHVELRWEDRSDGETSMILCAGHGDVVGCGIHPADTTTATIPAQAGATYRFEVQACRDLVCTDYSNSVTLSVDWLAPTVYAEIISPLAVRLSWDNPADDLGALTVDRQSGQEGLMVNSTLASSVNVYVDDLVVRGQTYLYSISLVSASLGRSSWSDPVSVTIP